MNWTAWLISSKHYRAQQSIFELDCRTDCESDRMAGCESDLDEISIGMRRNISTHIRRSGMATSRAYDMENTVDKVIGTFVNGKKTNCRK